MSGLNFGVLLVMAAPLFVALTYNANLAEHSVVLWVLALVTMGTGLLLVYQARGEEPSSGEEDTSTGL
ncbi:MULTISPECIES: hypothetical protein [Auritidibacter]|uniref:Uncharacterized protein n=2 Tax=Auritidibacter ignavus TaxID=678932 RepID=A0AAJ6DCF1_9MICC|nr:MULTISPECIES: hypothetical protein [Auritidibacter]NIH71043.1 putative ABC-type exoprotein transport system permease subunit [Auritidibacter ignavus]WGH83125.1 hypothetical protein QDX20_07525 [Auritidibacter ignavus]WGH92757.1 hypothetical protein QDX21_10690 [Auritidibacter ignavus]WHS28871.1 hypothetical protein QM395_03835 [Auritidibacter ignavus]